jgi:hypothetical protein
MKQLGTARLRLVFPRNGPDLVDGSHGPFCHRRRPTTFRRRGKMNVGCQPKRPQCFAEPRLCAFLVGRQESEAGDAVGAKIATGVRSRARDSAARSGRFF